jgi:hypothetical protein
VAVAKRGPAPKGEFSDKSQVFSTRISAELRARLEEAASKSGSTLSREVEHRLRRSFADDDAALEKFGSRRNRAVLKMLAAAMQTVYNPDRPNADWLDDPWLFDQCVRTLISLLEAIKPSGGIEPLSNPLLDLASKLQPGSRAAHILEEIQSADPSLPLNVSASEHIANSLKVDLGEVAERPKIVRGNAKSLRETAGGIEPNEKEKPE